MSTFWVIVLKYKATVLALKYITKVIVLTITSHVYYIFSYQQLQANILELEMGILEVI